MEGYPIEDLSLRQVEMITQNPYVHMKYYRRFPVNDLNYWAWELDRVRKSVKEDLDDLIKKQEAKESAVLDQIFRGKCTRTMLKEAGFDQEGADKFYRAFDKGKNRKTIEKRLEGLNELLSTHLYMKGEEEVKNVLLNIRDTITTAFKGKENLDLTFGNLEDSRLFISGLYQSAKRLQELQSTTGSEETEAGIDLAIRTLKAAIQYYKGVYDREFAKSRRASQEVDELFTGLESFLVGRKGNWKKKRREAKTFDEVKAYIEESVKGYGSNVGGKKKERDVAKNFLEDMEKIQKVVGIDVIDGKSTITGTNLDKLSKRSQKKDVEITFTLVAETGNKEEVSISFSVKKNKIGEPISFHSGGSLYAYAERFHHIGLGGENFDFLREGLASDDFQYVYVNELLSGDGDILKDSLEKLIQGAGFALLGQEMENYQGADFFFLQDRIYSFSGILKKIKKNQDVITAKSKIQSLQQPITKKRNLMDTINTKSRYSNKFISESIKIGTSLIKSNSFELRLSKAGYMLK